VLYTKITNVATIMVTIMSGTSRLVTALLLCAIVGMAIVVRLYPFHSQTPLTASTLATPARNLQRLPSTRRQTQDLSTVVSSPKRNACRTDSVLPSYVESRSVRRTNPTDDVSVCPYAQRNNHEPFSTLATSITEDTLQYATATSQPRVNLWKGRSCGIFV
jgi:hypothetical protein